MTRRDFWSAAAVLALAALAACSVGCTSTSSCSRDEDSLTVPLADPAAGIPDGGIVIGNTYISAPTTGPYTYFPANRTVTFVHGLGVTPDFPKIGLAFSRYGTLAPSAGNATELLNPDDASAPALNDHDITIHNDTCAEFYIWISTQAPICGDKLCGLPEVGALPDAGEALGAGGAPAGN